MKLICRESGYGTRLLDVALALSSFVSTGDSCYPGVETVAKRAGVCPRTAGEHLRKLERCGAISRKRKPKKHKTLGGSGQYRSWLIPPENWIWDRISAEFDLPVQSTPDMADLCNDPSISDDAAPSIGKSELSTGNVADLCTLCESANGVF